MPSEKFTAIFYQVKASGIWETKRVSVPYAMLKESTRTQKPESVFKFRNGFYVYDKEAIHEFDKKGRPIIRYMLGTATPANAKLPFNNLDNGYTISAGLLDTIFNRGEMKAAIAGSQKAAPKIDLMQSIIFLVCGGAVGYIIALAVNHIA